MRWEYTFFLPLAMNSRLVRPAQICSESRSSKVSLLLVEMNPSCRRRRPGHCLRRRRQGRDRVPVNRGRPRRGAAAAAARLGYVPRIVVRPGLPAPARTGAGRQPEPAAASHHVTALVTNCGINFVFLLTVQSVGSSSGTGRALAPPLFTTRVSNNGQKDRSLLN